MLNTAIVALVCLLGIALSVKSTVVLGRAAPWTSAGWLLTVVYFIEVIVKTTLAPAFPTALEYAVLAALAVAFVVAGVRDERQAEPWYWPNRQGTTRAEKRTV
jgi:predicted histidine transporter YuiF (NhaC family)